jgi:hypothetical protein
VFGITDQLPHQRRTDEPRTAGGEDGGVFHVSGFGFWVLGFLFRVSCFLFRVKCF